MATSGSSDFNMTRNQIIIDALEHIGGISEGETPTAEANTSAARSLNLMMKAWQAEGVNLWTLDWVTQTISASSVVLGSDGVDYECVRNHTSSTDDKPITGADYSTFWYQLATVAGGAWVTATAYASLANFDLASTTLEIEEMFVRDSQADYTMRKFSRSEYFALVKKNPDEKGRPTAFYFDLQEIPTVYLYPYPDLSTYVFHFAKVRKLQDFDSALNDADASAKFLEAIVYGLAARLATKYGRPESFIGTMTALAETSKARALLDDNERGDMQIAPFRGR